MEAINVTNNKSQKKLRSARLKELRYLLKFTQKDMARILHITQVGYFRMENGDNDITVDKIFALSKEFGLSPTWLVCGIGGMFDPKIKMKQTDEEWEASDADHHDLAV
jgi:transcriptional regulator with XRE-family HTH domain